MSQQVDTRHLGRKNPQGDGVDGEHGAQESVVVTSPEHMDFTPDFHGKPAGGGMDGEGGAHESLVDPSLEHMNPTLDIPEKPAGDGTFGEAGAHESIGDPSVEHMNPTLDNQGNPAGDGIDSQGGAHEVLLDPSLEHMNATPDNHENPAGDGIDSQDREHEALVDPSLEPMNPTLDNHENPAGDGIDSQGGAHEVLLDPSLEHMNATPDNHENPAGDGIDSQDRAHEALVDPSLEHMNPTLDNHENPAGDWIDSQDGAHQSIVDPSLEYTDPNPDIHELFRQFNERFFEGCLSAVEVKWSYKMISMAGACDIGEPGGVCRIVLSEPVLKLRPRKDLVQTLLHEMIHAYLRVRNKERSRRHHGPEFVAVMQRINREAGTAISVFHEYAAEVMYYWQHWYRCDGRCGNWMPCFAKRRHKHCPPWPRSKFYRDHRATCGGTYRKVRCPQRCTTPYNNALPWPSMDFLDILEESRQTSPVVPYQPTRTVPVMNDQATQSTPVKHDQATQTIVNRNQASQTSPIATEGLGSDSDTKDSAEGVGLGSDGDTGDSAEGAPSAGPTACEGAPSA